MQANEQELFLGVFDIQDAKRIQAILKEREVPIRLQHNGETCGTGSCSVRVEVWGQEENKAEIITFFQNEQAKNLEGLNFDPELMNSVYDPNAKEVTCQACGFKFSPDKNECPDCGLFYG